MNRIDKTISLFFLGLPVPVILMLLFWWVSVPIFGNNDFMYLLLIPAGLVIGVVLDMTVLRQYLLRLFVLPTSVQFVVLTFYSLMIYGLFMGFPVFNILVGIAGIYIVARSGHIQHASKDILHKNAKKTHLFSFALLLLICITTAIMALSEKTIGLELKMMLDLPFDVTPGMIWTLILIGTILLLSCQYLISKIVFNTMLKRHPF